MMSLVWGLLFGLVYFLITKQRRNSILMVGLVFSHWILDFITHRPDLQITPYSNYRVGLGLWNYPVIEIILEVGVFLLGVYFYFTSMRPKRRVSFWSLIGLLLVIHIMNLNAPAPPSAEAVAWSAILVWVFIIWAWWIERGVKQQWAH